MNNFQLLLYFIILGSALYYNNYVAILGIIALGIIILTLFSTYKKTRIESIKNKKVVLNINKASWWEIEQLSEFQRVSAKKQYGLENTTATIHLKKIFIKKTI